jgi:hypothetical protein
VNNSQQAVKQLANEKALEKLILRLCNIKNQRKLPNENKGQIKAGNFGYSQQAV